jgi:hypothetical protein
MWFLPHGFPAKALYALIIPIHETCAFHVDFLDLITPIFDDEQSYTFLCPLRNFFIPVLLPLCL